ncbi:hypothetical protein AVEN_176140-1, partial [Araneus ventricosus]
RKPFIEFKWLFEERLLCRYLLVTAIEVRIITVPGRPIVHLSNGYHSSVTRQRTTLAKQATKEVTSPPPQAPKCHLKKYAYEPLFSMATRLRFRRHWESNFYYFLPKVTLTPLSWSGDHPLFCCWCHGPILSHLYRFRLYYPDICACGEKGDATSCS